MRHVQEDNLNRGVPKGGEFSITLCKHNGEHKTFFDLHTHSRICWQTVYGKKLSAHNSM